MNQFSNPTDTMYIPKIIHQVWSGIDKPLPKLSHVLGNTWKRDYPEWDYILWDNDKSIIPNIGKHTIYFHIIYNVGMPSAIYSCIDSAVCM